VAEVDLQAIYDSMTPEQKDACGWFTRAALYDHQDIPKDVQAAHDAMTDEQKLVLDHMVKSTTTYRPSEDDG